MALSERKGSSKRKIKNTKLINVIDLNSEKNTLKDVYQKQTCIHTYIHTYIHTHR